ncbi:hypothetical protein V6R21_01370 [Limibacter armeniacum]|uniref:hypothetical protein n=1 Tax=Limibacter armeniacum TaxID=466084 RepID=UPI002FE66D1D
MKGIESNYMIVFLIIILMSCDVICSEYIKVPSFGAEYSNPYVYIDEKLDECTYSISGILMINNVVNEIKGEVKKVDNSLVVKLIAPRSKEFTWFDFKVEVGSVYRCYLSDCTNFTMILESIFKDSRRGDVYFFKQKNGYLYEGISLDIVYLVTQEEGVIGTYLIGKECGEEVIAGPEGDILLDQVKYKQRFVRML